MNHINASNLGRDFALEEPAAPKRTRRRSSPPPKKLPARTAARYGKALEAIDEGDKKKAKKRRGR